jgi:flagellar basal-body rod protein FlgG
MIPHIRKQEMTANNLANAAASGYKKDSLFTRELSKAEQKRIPRKSDWEQPMATNVFTDFSQGVFDKTENPLDLAIDGDGFFTLQLQDGTTVLTRSGSFTVNNDGLIAFPGGALLQGEGGAMEVGSGQVTVAGTGEIEVNGFAVGKIAPVTVEDVTKLEKLGGSMFIVPDGAELIPVSKSSIRQGYLEAANLDIVNEMVEMIVSYRSYEANAKAVQSQDESLEHLFNRVGSKR